MKSRHDDQQVLDASGASGSGFRRASGSASGGTPDASDGSRGARP